MRIGDSENFIAANLISDRALYDLSLIKIIFGQNLFHHESQEIC